MKAFYDEPKELGMVIWFKVLTVMLLIMALSYYYRDIPKSNNQKSTLYHDTSRRK